MKKKKFGKKIGKIILTKNVLKKNVEQKMCEKNLETKFFEKKNSSSPAKIIFPPARGVPNDLNSEIQ